MKHILGCINYCHLNNVIHRDLKPENVLMEKNLEPDSIKIIDFGLSVKSDKAARYSEMVGTPYYVAPEVMKGNYGKKIDVWACGVITYILLGGVPPFNGHTDKEILKKVKKGKISFEDPRWENISDQAKDFI
jgi:calcium-dependent protein kinase